MENMRQRKYYIAYGSNLNINQMRYRCPGAKVIGTGEIPDYELLFKGSKTGSYLTIEKHKGSTVPVAVWSVTTEDERRLDLYEGCPSFYYKTEMNLIVKGIRSGSLRLLRAFVYIMHEERNVGIPTHGYLSTCMEGYHDFGFPTEPLAVAYKKSREAAE